MLLTRIAPAGHIATRTIHTLIHGARLSPATTRLAWRRQAPGATAGMATSSSTSNANNSCSNSKIVTKDKVYDEHWQLPQGTNQPKLRVWNSLTRSKVEFVPQSGKQITWYNCGPTVYDASHMGHARNYVTQDFLRRILRDYFGYDIHFVMNITDIDDKIIVRARQEHLFATCLNETTALTPEVIAQVQEAWSQYFEKFSKKIASTPATPVPETEQRGDPATSSASTLQSTSRLTWEELQSKISNDAAWVQAVKENNEKFGMQMDTLTASRKGLDRAQQDLDSGRTGRDAASDLLNSARDVVSELLDKQKGDTVTDPAIFRSLAAYWEKDYFDDMERLHVEPPNTLTRVSEYLPEITAFVEKIIENGYAYKGEDGSVYFDTKAFDGAKGTDPVAAGQTPEEYCHTYAKLQPWSKGNKALLEDGEGALSVTGRTKKSASDFALWKASKPGEPAWPSKWGQGRPGWHIECSVMASDVLGSTMDIHSGGVDLAFPHHDNEIAQSEAHHECRQWVNYFLHTGHLHIEGLKMSKSLKNFITIKEALEKTSPRQLRLAFLLQTWNARMDFNEKDMAEVRSIESRFNKFFTNVSALVSDLEARAQESKGQHQYRLAEKELMQSLKSTQDTFHAALCDSFATPRAILALSGLVTSANVYSTSHSRSETNIDVLRAVTDWVTRMLRMLGLGEGPEADARGKRIVGWGQARSGAANGEASADDRETILMPYLRALSTFRDSVRKIAREDGRAAEILALCDQLRDNEMVDLGVALDDQEDGRALVKLVPAEQLRAVRDEKTAAAREKQNKKAAAQAAAEAKRLEKLEKGKVSPRVMFKTADYSKWDSEGLPTHDAQGEELAKSRLKKLKKEWEGQARLHEAYLAETK